MTLEELQTYLDSLPDKVQAELATVLRQQAERLSAAQRAELQAQLQDPAETGHLEESCRVETRDGPLDVHVVAGGELTETEVRTGSGEAWDRALGFEFGTSHQPARPFFYSTYQAMKPSINDAISNAIEKAINE